MKNEIPPSREVRIRENSPITDVERVAFSIYSGDAGNLATNLVKLELLVESKQARALEALATILRQKLLLDGYVVIEDIDEGVKKWHEEDVLGEHGTR
jgi:hypothetical protein